MISTRYSRYVLVLTSTIYTLTHEHVSQCLLSGCMWGLNRFQRPAWTTATTLPAAFLCGIFSGFYIYWGGRKTKRHEQVEERLRTALALENPQQAPSDTFATEEGDGPVQPAQESSPESTEESSGMHHEKSEESRVESNGTSSTSEVLPQDFAKHENTDTQLPGIRQRNRQESTATVPIADQMTIPPAEELHETEGAVQGRKR